MPDTVVVYCDESGNSGPNYLDPAQPFYVIGGWIVPADQIVNVSVMLEELRSDHCPQREEIKSAAMLNSERRKAGVADLFERLGQIGCCPIYLYAEKRYCVAGKIVETFLDPAFNPKLRTGFITDITSKQEIANLLYAHLPDEALCRFAVAYRNPTLEGFVASLNEILEAVRSNINPELAKALGGSERSLHEIAEAEQGANSHGRAYKAFNLPALVSFLMMVEHLARQGCFVVEKVTHDEQHTYRDDFMDLFRMHQTETEGCFLYPNGAAHYASLQSIPKFEMVPSHTVVPIQAADLLAGVVNHLCTKALCDEEYSPADITLGDLTLPAMLSPDVRVAWPIGSDRFYRNLGDAYFSKFRSEDRGDVTRSDVPCLPGPPTCDLPIVPVTANVEDLPKTAERRLKVDMPLYGLVGKKSGGLMVIDLGAEAAEHTDIRTALVLFSARKTAEGFLAGFSAGDMTEEQEIRCFGPTTSDLFELCDKLYSCLPVTRALLYDGDIAHGPYVRLKEFTDGLIRSTERVVRAFRSGLDRVIVERHNISGVQVTSVLTSDGKYGAVVIPNGKVYFGKTRQEAIDRLKEGEGI